MLQPELSEKYVSDGKNVTAIIVRSDEVMNSAINAASLHYYEASSFVLFPIKAFCNFETDDLNDVASMNRNASCARDNFS